MLAKHSLLLLVLLSVAACSVDRKDPSIRHEQSKVKESEPFEASGESVDPYAQEKAQINQSPQKAISTLQSLSAEFLNQKNLRNKNFTSSSEKRRGLNVFNRTLLASLSTSETQAKAGEILKQYASILRVGCKENSWNNCSHLEFFKNDALTAMVGLKIAGRQTRKLDGLIWQDLAYELGNSQGNEELRQALLSQALIVYRFLVLHNPAGLNRYAEVVGIELDAGQGQPLSANFANQLPDWYDLIASGEITRTLGPRFENSLIGLITANLHQSALWNRFAEKAGLKVTRYKDSELPEGYQSILNWLARTGPRILKNMNVPVLTLANKDEARDNIIFFYISDQLLDLRPIDKLRPFWNASNRDPMPMLEDLDIMLRTYFIRNLVYGNRSMSAFFRRELKKGTARNKLLQLTADYADENVAQIWKDFSARVNHVRDFFNDEIKPQHQYSANEDVRKKVADFERILNEYPSNIVFMSAYPNMIMLAYYAYIWDYNEKILAPWNDRQVISIEKSALASEILIGRVPSLFRFVDSKDSVREMDAFKALWSFYFAMKTDLLDQYEISADEWVRTFFKGFMDTHITDMRKQVDAFTAFEAPTESYQRLLNVCEYGKGSNVIPIDDLKESMAYGITPSEWKNPLTIGRRMFFGGSGSGSQPFIGTISESFEHIRSDVDSHLSLLKLLKTLLAENGKNTGEITSLIAEVSEQRRTVLTRANRILNRADACFFKLSKIDHARRMAVVDDQLAYLQRVTKKLQLLEKLGEDGLLFAADASSRHPEIVELRGLPGDKSVLLGLNEQLIKESGLETVLKINPEYRDNLLANGGIQRDRDARGQYFFYYRKIDAYMLAAASIQNRYGANSPDGLNTTVGVPFNLRNLRLAFYAYNEDIPTGEPLYLHNGDLKGFYTAYMIRLNPDFQLINTYSQLDYALRYQLLTRVSGYKMAFSDRYDLDFMANCKVDCQKGAIIEMRREMQPLLKTMQDYLDFTVLRPNSHELRLLQFTQSDNFYNPKDAVATPNGPENLFVNGSFSEGNKFMGMGDELFAYLVSIKLGKDPQFLPVRASSVADWKVKVQPGNGNELNLAKLLRRENPYKVLEYEDEASLAELQSFVEAEDELVFAIPQETMRYLRLSQNRLIQLDMLIAQAAMEEFSEREEPKGPMVFSIHHPGLDKLFWLSEHVRDQYQVKIRRFNQLTHGVDIPELLKEYPSWKPDKSDKAFFKAGEAPPQSESSAPSADSSSAAESATDKATGHDQ